MVEILDIQVVVTIMSVQQYGFMQRNCYAHACTPIIFICCSPKVLKYSDSMNAVPFSLRYS